MICSQEVVGSSPIFSTLKINHLHHIVGGFFIYILRLNIDISWQLFGLYFIGDRVQPSFSLDPEILKAEGQAFSEDKRHYVHRIRRLTKLVVATCERIEHSPVQSKDFLQLLKKEL